MDLEDIPMNEGMSWMLAEERSEVQKLCSVRLGLIPKGEETEVRRKPI